VSGPGRPTAVELSAYAATQAISDLLRANNDVAVAVLGLDGEGHAGLHWIPPGGGQEQRARALRVFNAAIDQGRALVATSEQGGGPGAPAGPRGRRGRTVAASKRRTMAQVERLVSLSPPGSQFVLFSPMLDDDAVDVVETWAAHGIPRSVLSPDVIPANTVGGQLSAVDRGRRLARCQATGARTVDWRRGTPLQVALERAFAVDTQVGTRITARTPRGGGE